MVTINTMFACHRNCRRRFYKFVAIVFAAYTIVTLLTKAFEFIFGMRGGQDEMLSATRRMFTGTIPSSTDGIHTNVRASPGAAQVHERLLKSRRPHIVMVVADDLGWNDIGYHNPKMKSPTLDHLANTGVKLENYYVQPICSPSRVQLLSGKYQIHLGLQHSLIFLNRAMGIPLDVPTIGDQLQAQGYRTHAAGKWHAGFYTWDHMPTRRGFHSYLGHVGSLGDYYKKTQCVNYDEQDWECGLVVYDNETIVENNTEYSAHFYTRRAQQIIHNHPKDEPLFLYLAYQNVHSPLQVPQHYAEMYPDFEDKDRRTYAGMVSCLDEAVRNVTEALEDEGMWDNAVFIFTTDNGGSPKFGGNNWPLRGGKHSHWEGGVKAVGFVHSKTHLVNTSHDSHGLMHITDWYPTLLHLAGGQLIPNKLDGHNVWNMISLGEASPRREIIHNIDPVEELRGQRLYPDTFDNRQHAALRVDDWKLITGRPGGPHTWTVPPESPEILHDPSAGHDSDPDKNIWLFNITADPCERTDLSSRYPGVVKMMLDKLAEYERTAVPCSWPEPDPASRPSLHNGTWQPWLKAT